jgi:hypothetical protein
LSKGLLPFELAHDPEKACPALDAGREAVFPKDHAQTTVQSAMVHPDAITL